MPSNDFLTFAGGAGANVLSQADYAALAASIGANGFSAGTAQSAQVNKVWRQASIMSAVLAQLIVDLTGQNAVDDGTTTTLLANLKAAIGSQSAGVVGEARNAKMVVAAASNAATFTADEVVVVTALGGTPFRLGNFSQTVSTSATGIGGVVGGALTANGYAAIYAAYNPTTRAQGAFIVNANSLVPNVAASPPAGWIATALVSVWPLNSSTQFVPGTQRGRRVGLVTAGGFTVSATQTSYASVAVSGIPANAVRLQGNLSSLSTVSNATIIFSVAPDAAGTSVKSNVSTTVVGNNGTSMPVEIDIFTPQTLYYRMPGSTGTPSMSLVATSYDF